MGKGDSQREQWRRGQSVTWHHPPQTTSPRSSSRWWYFSFSQPVQPIDAGLAGVPCSEFDSGQNDFARSFETSFAVATSKLGPVRTDLARADRSAVRAKQSPSRAENIDLHAVEKDDSICSNM